jgi:hypothetical protein
MKLFIKRQFKVFGSCTLDGQEFGGHVRRPFHGQFLSANFYYLSVCTKILVREISKLVRIIQYFSPGNSINCPYN